MTVILLEHCVWAVISVLGGLLPVLMFVLGGNTTVRTLSREEEKRAGLTSFFSGLWYLPPAGLLLFVGLLCWAFPAYFRVFVCGAAGLWSALAASFAVAAAGALMGRSRRALLQAAGRSLSTLGGIAAPLLAGVVLGCFFSGAPFLQGAEVDAGGGLRLAGAVWFGQAGGLEAFMLLDNLLLGAALLYLCRILSMLYLVVRGAGGEVRTRVRSLLLTETVFFLIFYLAFVVRLCMRIGLVWNEGAFMGVVRRYLQNFVEMPAVGFLLLVGLVLLVAGISRTIFCASSRRGFFAAAAGTLLSFTALLLAAGFNRTPYLPSTYDWQHSLSISNSHASIGALAAVLVVGIVVLLAGAMWLVSRVRRFSGAGGEAS